MENNNSDKNVTIDTIYFYSKNKEYNWLSNFSNHSVIIDNKKYKTVEHYYQYKKYENLSNNYTDAILNAEHAFIAKKLASDYKKQGLENIENWNSLRDDIMLKALVAKFSQHDYLKNQLLNTVGFKLVHFAPWDDYWGDGKNKDGLNKMGVMLECIREVLVERLDNKPKIKSKI